LYREGHTLEEARERLTAQLGELELLKDADCIADLSATLAFIEQSGRGIVRP
jgi:hypothetical protein